MEFAASKAYEQRTGDADAFWDAVDALPEEPQDEPKQGESWSGRFGSADDAAQIPLRLPRLYQLVGGDADS